MMIPTTLDRKKMKKWQKCPALAIVLALLLVLCSLPVYAGEQQTEQTETPTVTQDTGSESAESVASSENDELIADELEPMQPIDRQDPEVAATTDWTQEQPHEGQVLHGGYVGFKNKASGKYMTIPGGATAVGTNVCQQNENGIINSQEFYLTHTYNAEHKNISYFTIYSINMSGQTAQTRMKAGNISLAGQANVSLQYMMPTEMNDRWQIEHYADNYYIIYMGSRPSTSDVRYIMRATEGQGTLTGTETTSPGNVYVTALDLMIPPSDHMLWEICVDGEPVDIYSNDITQNTERIVDVGDYSEYFYIPKSFNCDVEWQVQGSGELIEPGIIKTNNFGTADMIVEITPSNGTAIEEISRLRMLPPDGATFYIQNVGTERYVDIEGPSMNMGAPIQQWDFHMGDYEKWQIEYDDANSGYVWIKSVYSGLFITPGLADVTKFSQTNLRADYSLWKINTSASGYFILVPKRWESENQVLTVPTSSNHLGANLAVAAYTNDTNYYDEWMLYQYDRTLEIAHYYDQGFAVRCQPIDDAEDLIESYQEFVAEKYLHEFGLEIVSSYSSVISSADQCKIQGDISGQVTSDNIDVECKCLVEDKCTSRTAISTCVNNGTNNKTIVIWTGHITDGNLGSVMFGGTYKIVITPRGKEYSTELSFDVAAENLFDLIHEVSHTLDAPDHYCSGRDESGVCGNESCDQCVYGYLECRTCIMGDREGVASIIVNDTFCYDCIDIINNHIDDHH